MILPIRLIWNLQMKTRQKLSIGGLFCFGWICIIISTIRVVQLGETENGVPAPSWLALWGTIEASIAVMIGCCPGLYRVLKTAISPSKASYPYDTYNLRGPGGSGIPSHRSGAFVGTDAPLNGFRGKEEIYQSASAYRSTSPSSSQENLTHPSDKRNIMVNYGVAVTVEDRPSDYGQAARFVRVGLVNSNIALHDHQHAYNPAVLDLISEATHSGVLFRCLTGFISHRKLETLAGQAGRSRQKLCSLETWPHDHEALEIDNIVKAEIRC
ncbi:hypothetical protein HAV15_013196 [Penicillium sp. str. |nr:hypothetical protein HAV15_013196 [Penicillium sp. str. \